MTIRYTRLNSSWFIISKKTKFLFKLLFILLILSTIIFFLTYNVTLNLRIYLKDWITNEEFGREALSSYGCFSKNVSENDQKKIYDGPKIVYNEIVPPTPLTEAWDCYDFANRIRLLPGQPREHVVFHSYWRIDLKEIGEKQIATLRSFFATQDNNYSSLILWSNGNLSNDKGLEPFFEKYPDRFSTRLYEVEKESSGTPIENSQYINIKDDLAYLDGDLVRLLVLYKYGGVWFDMDSLFIRDFSPLVEHEWVGQWDCFIPDGFPFNGAFMRFRKNSPYVCEMLSEIHNGPQPGKNSFNWGSYLYLKIYRRLIQNGKQPFKIIPWCFTDSHVCRPSNSMPSAFEENDGFNKDRLLQTFAYHWHNQWEKKPGSLFRFLEERHKVLDLE
ncbi:12037_t:CDS:1 [Entrophospora sp. SA101]|nr:8307_t:CDS:1 [Entrophospora sp. SA101]CAJ0862623.1 12037_t:CDS:1 [Entrophospora sp. SA101]